MIGIFQTFWKSTHDNKGPILHLLFSEKENVAHKEHQAI